MRESKTLFFDDIHRKNRLISMELRQLKYFLRAKELLNFTEAAKSLNISQRTLSQQIGQLEAELDVPLFNRVGKRITLTEAGHLFSDYALQSISRANEGYLVLKDLKNLNTWNLTIGVIYSMRILFAKTLIEFAARFPKIKIRVVFGTTKDLLEKLQSHQFDFILTFLGATEDLHLNIRHYCSQTWSLLRQEIRSWQAASIFRSMRWLVCRWPCLLAAKTVYSFLRNRLVRESSRPTFAWK